MKPMKPVKTGSCGMFTAVVPQRSVPHLINAGDGLQSWVQTGSESLELIRGALVLGFFVYITKNGEQQWDVC